MRTRHTLSTDRAVRTRHTLSTDRAVGTRPSLQTGQCVQDPLCRQGSAYKTHTLYRQGSAYKTFSADRVARTRPGLGRAGAVRGNNNKSAARRFHLCFCQIKRSRRSRAGGPGVRYRSPSSLISTRLTSRQGRQTMKQGRQIFPSIGFQGARG